MTQHKNGKSNHVKKSSLLTFLLPKIETLNLKTQTKFYVTRLILFYKKENVNGIFFSNLL